MSGRAAVRDFERLSWRLKWFYLRQSGGGGAEVFLLGKNGLEGSDHILHDGIVQVVDVWREGRPMEEAL